jgi:hypothetical protein
VRSSAYPRSPKNGQQWFVWSSAKHAVCFRVSKAKYMKTFMAVGALFLFSALPYPTAACTVAFCLDKGVELRRDFAPTDLAGFTRWKLRRHVS